jgi:uncharacterized protein involved in exopolysaccharide biosynthesis
LVGESNQLLSLDVALQSTVISDYRRQGAEIQRKIGESVSTYGEQHPTVMGLKAQLENLNREVEREIKRIIDNRALAFEAANGKVKLLETSLQRLTENVLKFDEYQIKLSEFKRDCRCVKRALLILAASLQRDEGAGEAAGHRRPDRVGCNRSSKPHLSEEGARFAVSECRLARCRRRPRPSA